MQQVIFRGAGNGSIAKPFILETGEKFDSLAPFMIKIESNFEGFPLQTNYFKVNNKTYLMASLELKDDSHIIYEPANAIVKTFIRTDKNHIVDGPYLLSHYNGLDYITKMQVNEGYKLVNSEHVKIDAIESLEDYARLINKGINSYFIKNLSSNIFYTTFNGQRKWLQGAAVIEVLRVEEHLEEDKVFHYIIVRDENGISTSGILEIIGGSSFVERVWDWATVLRNDIEDTIRTAVESGEVIIPFAIRAERDVYGTAIHEGYYRRGEDIELEPAYEPAVSGDKSDSDKLILKTAKVESVYGEPAHYLRSSEPLSSGIQDIDFSPDGLNVYAANATADSIEQYKLTTPWDITTINVEPVFSLGVKLFETSPNGLYIREDGKKLFFIGSANKKVYSYDLVTPFELSSYANLKSSDALPNLASSRLEDLYFSSDGRKLYVANSTADMVNTFDLTSPWDVATITNYNAGLYVGAQEIVVTGLYIEPTGNILYALGSDSDKVHQYQLHSPWGSQGEYENKSIDTQQAITTGVFFKPDGTRMYLIGTSSRSIDEYVLPKHWDLDRDKAEVNRIEENYSIQVKLNEDDEPYLEIDYKKENEMPVPLFKLNKGGVIEKGIVPFANVSNKPNTLSGYGITDAVKKMIPITYASLVVLRDSASLIPGQQYRITDFVTTTAQENTQSAGHQFDIIVVADGVNKLNEQARAIQHAGDTYFANSKLEAWQVWYSLDNDTTRFAWADEVNGKGVIYRMIDEWNNDVPYDFKNIQFIRTLTDGELDLEDGIDTWVYTFNAYDTHLQLIQDATTSVYRKTTPPPGIGDDTYRDGCEDNSIGVYDWVDDGWTDVLHLSNNVFLNTHYYVDDTDCVFVSCMFNKLGSVNSYNTFGGRCWGNTFGDYCDYNTFGNDCHYNTFGTSGNSNIFGNHCSSNTFGNDCSDNTFGNGCSDNTFGNSCSDNTFGNSCYNNLFGNSCNSNTFGNYFVFNTVKNNVQYVRTPDAVNASRFQYVTLENGLKGASSANRLNLEGIQAVVGYDTPIKVARGVGTEIVAVWQNGIELAGLRKETPTTADWS